MTIELHGLVSGTQLGERRDRLGTMTQMNKVKEDTTYESKLNDWTDLCALGVGHHFSSATGIGFR